MKKGMLVLTIVLMCVGVSFAQEKSEKHFAAWLYGTMDYDADNDLSGRLGYIDEQVEVGMCSTWYGPKLGAPQVYGAYGIYWLPEPIDVNSPINIDFLPERIVAWPYVGGQVSIDIEEDGAYRGIIAGLRFYEILILEYQYTDFETQLDAMNTGDRHKVLFGFRVTF